MQNGTDESRVYLLNFDIKKGNTDVSTSSETLIRGNLNNRYYSQEMVPLLKIKKPL